jgi:hypothetical protein
MEIKSELEPIMVKNPHTNTVINIAPIFELLHQSGIKEESTKSMEAQMDTIIRFFSLQLLLEDGNEQQDRMSIMYHLYMLKDTFSLMTEYKTN